MKKQALGIIAMVIVVCQLNVNILFAQTVDDKSTPEISYHSSPKQLFSLTNDLINEFANGQMC